TEVPKRVEEALQCEGTVKRIARTYQAAQDFLFLGRGAMHPVALEGALKLKEISYIHAEGYAGGGMKHGPIALIDPKRPLAAPGERRPPDEKLRGNVGGGRAGGGRVPALGEGEAGVAGGLADEVTRPPASPALLAPIVATVPLQLLAYHVADLRGNDVDQPRN